MSPWLTKLVLDPRNRHVHAILADGGLQHKWLMGLVKDGLGDQPRRAAGLLYRIEEDRKGTTVLVQTLAEPKLDALGMDGVVSAATRQLTPQFDAIDMGSIVRYRIVANPSKRWGNSAPDPAMIGKLHIIRGPAAATWWTQRAAASGLATEAVEWRPLLDIPAKRRGRHARAQFDGLATVTDPDVLRSAISTGIGRSQSFGCGLLSIAVLRSGRPD